MSLHWIGSIPELGVLGTSGTKILSYNHLCALTPKNRQQHGFPRSYLTVSHLWIRCVVYSIYRYQEWNLCHWLFKTHHWFCKALLSSNSSPDLVSLNLHLCTCINYSKQNRVQVFTRDLRHSNNINNKNH